MSLKTAMWVHGLITQAENPVHAEVVKGWGKEFVSHWMSNWFHIPFTTPAILEDIRPKLEQVYVFYKTDGAVINAVHIYDGPFKVKAFDDIAVEGDHSEKSDEFNTWDIDPPLEMNFGLGISLLVTNKLYKNNEAQGEPLPSVDVETNPYEVSAAKKVSISKVLASVLFTAAGADFQVPGPDIQCDGPGTNMLLPNHCLVRGSSLISNNGMYELVFDSKGDVVLYNKSDGSVIYHSGTYAPAGIVPDAYLRMQGDGNLVVERSGMGTIWASGTEGHPGAFLRVEDDGKIEIIDPVNRLWHRPE